MTYTERTLGQLQEFKSWAKAEFEELRHNQLTIMEKLDRINQDRWIMYGKLTIINGIIILALELIPRFLFP